MQCAIIAAAAAFASPVVNAGVSAGCDGGDVIGHLRRGDWLGAAGSVGCGWFSDLFATSAGIFVAGAAIETGPGAAFAGYYTYQALDAGMKLVCGGVLTGPPTELGVKFEAGHEAAIAVDVIRHGSASGRPAQAGRRHAVVGGSVPVAEGG